MSTNIVTDQTSPGFVVDRAALEGKRLLFLGAAPGLDELLATFSGLGLFVTRGEHFDPKVTEGDYDVTILHYDSLPNTDRVGLAASIARAHNRGRLLLLTDGDCRRDYPSIFETGVFTNFVARNRLESHELCITVQKILTGQIFGIQQYFAVDADQRRFEVRGSHQKVPMTEQADAFTSSLKVNQRLASHFALVTEELLLNSLYDAPVDRDGTPRFLDRDRTMPVSLEGGEVVVVKFASDGTRLGVSVRDPFGSLRPERVLQYLSKCFAKGEDQIDAKPGGAGLGLYMIFESLTHLIINMEPGKRTEMIGLIDIRGSFRDFQRANKSFNIFVA